jgi:hypothetical protein
MSNRKPSSSAATLVTAPCMNCCRPRYGWVRKGWCSAGFHSMSSSMWDMNVSTSPARNASRSSRTVAAALSGVAVSYSSAYCLACLLPMDPPQA